MERRHGRRFDIQWPVYIGHPKCGYVRGKTLDVSISGLAFQCPLRYPVAEQVSLQIEISATEVVRCVALIVRETASTNGKFAYSARLLRVQDSDRRTYTDALLALRRTELAKQAGS